MSGSGDVLAGISAIIGRCDRRTSQDLSPLARSAALTIRGASRLLVRLAAPAAGAGVGPRPSEPTSRHAEHSRALGPGGPTNELDVTDRTRSPDTRRPELAGDTAEL